MANGIAAAGIQAQAATAGAGRPTGGAGRLRERDPHDESWSDWGWPGWQGASNGAGWSKGGASDLMVLEDFSGADVSKYRTWKKR